MKLVALVAVVMGLTVSASAQAPASRSHRLGILGTTQLSLSLTRDAVLPALVARGFEEGRNLIVDERTAPAGGLSEAVRKMVALHPDVIIAIGNDAVQAAHAESERIPIVLFGPDPVRMGLARTLSKPGGKVTGIVILASELDAKRLHLLHEAMPNLRRVAVLLRTDLVTAQASEQEMRSVAERVGIDLLRFDAVGPSDYASAFDAMREARVEALVIGADPVFYRDTNQLLALANAGRLPTACQWSEMAEAGCLFSYGPNLRESRIRIADFVAKILRGASAADLPIERPTRFDLLVNVKAARAMGASISTGFLARADEVIE